MTKHKRILIGFIAIAVISYAVLQCLSPLLVRFGTPAIRQVIMSGWTDSRYELGFFKKRVCITLLYKDVGDPSAASMALSVLKAHLTEDEDNIVRHLAYVSYTAKNPTDCHLALTGLKSVSLRHREIAVGAFLYQLNHSDSGQDSNAMKLATAAEGLAKYSCTEALPGIIRLLDHPNKYLASAARNSAEHLQASQPTTERLQPK